MAGQNSAEIIKTVCFFKNKTEQVHPLCSGFSCGQNNLESSYFDQITLNSLNGGKKGLEEKFI